MYLVQKNNALISESATMTEEEKKELIEKIKALKIPMFPNGFDIEYMKKVAEAQRIIIELIEKQ